MKTAPVVLLLLVCPLAAADRLVSRPRPPAPEVKAVPVGEEVRTGSERRRVVLLDGSSLFVNQRTTVKVVAERRLKLERGEILLDVVSKKEPFVVDTPKRQVAAVGTTFAVRLADAGTAVVVARGKVTVTEGERQRDLLPGQRLTADGDRPEAAPRPSQLFDWARELMIAAESPLIPASTHSGGSVTIVDPNGQEAKLHLRKYHIDVHIEDGFARTTIDQTFFNHTHGRLEGTFHFPLPSDASLSRLAMYVDGTRMEGGMVERDQGRNIYESIVTRQQDPALLEWVDGSTFKMRVFPLEARQEKRILLSYTQRLNSYAGQETYRFPAGHSLDRVKDWSLNLRVKHGDKLDWNSLSHTLNPNHADGDLLLSASEKSAKLDRDVVVTLGRQQEGAASRFSTTDHDGNRYFMVRHRPDLTRFGKQGRTRRDVVVLFETSGDREPLLGRAQVEIVRGLLQNALPEDRLHVLTAGTRTRLLAQDWQPLTPETAQEAIRFLENSHLIGALDLDTAFTEAARLLKDSTSPQLIHVGSGIAAMGEQRNDVLVQRLPKEVQYVGIGVGRRWNRALMKAVAEKAGGVFTQINPDEPLSWRTFELADILNGPRLLDVRVTDKTNRYLTFASVVNQGEEVCAVAGLDNKEVPTKVTVSGLLLGQPVEFELDVQNVLKEAGVLPRTWAKLEIDRLLAEDAAKHKNAIVKLSKEQYVMTPFTSLLVLESEAMYQQYKVERGRKDPWGQYEAPAKVAVVYEPEDGVDPKQAKRPGPKQVLETVVTRSLPGVLSRLSNRGFGTSNRTDPWLMGGELADPKPEARPGSNVQSSTPQDGNATEDGMVTPFSEKIFTAPVTPVPTLFVPNPATVQSLETDQVTGPTSGRPAQVFIVGNTTTNNNVILRQVPLYPGSPLSYPALREAEQQLSNLSLIERKHERWKPSRHIRDDLFDRTAGSLTLRSDQVRVASGDLVHVRPTFNLNPRLFSDLVSYATGMSNSTADLLAVLDNEAAPSAATKAGKIDEAARRLFQKAGAVGWREFQLPAIGKEPALRIVFDGAGRFSYERTLFPGIREQVVSDGKTLWHLYPDLRIGAKRTLSRHHRLAFRELVPVAVPSPEDLARGADLVGIDERTVAVVPHGKGTLRQHLIFDADGLLVEQQLVEMPAQKIVTRLIFDATKGLRRLDADGKEKASLAATLAKATVPNLEPKVKELVILPLPYRTRQHIVETRKLQDKRNEDLPFDDALALFAADFAAGNGDSLVKLFKEAFHGRDQRHLGLYVLLAAAGQNLDASNLDVLSEHRDEPLAQYLALHSSPVLRKHASQWALSGVQWGDGALRHLAVTHALLQRWQTMAVLEGNRKQRQDALDTALDYVTKHKNSAFAFALLGQLTDRANEADDNKKDVADVRRALARAWIDVSETPCLETAARYEAARALWKTGKPAEARKAFLALYRSARQDDGLLLIDDDFHRALLGDGKTPDEWNSLLRRTAQELIDKKHRPAVLFLARQCWSLNDQPLAQELLGMLLDGVKEREERLKLTVAVVEFLRQSGKFIEAEQWLQPLLEDVKWTKRADLWRLAAKLAEGRELPARQLECLERALDAEYRDRPEVMRLETIDSEYGRLLAHYQNLTEAMLALKVKPPDDFLTKVVRTADRWRSLSKNGTQACDTAARILRQLGERELAWDYLTTPVGLQPGSSQPWLGLAETLRRQGELKLADGAFASAFAAEATNAQILWDRAQNLRQSGNVVEAQKLLRQLADGNWQPRFQSLVSQARWQLERR